jgi:hypothetical protein
LRYVLHAASSYSFLSDHDWKGFHQSEEICFSARCLASYLAFSRSNVSICATMSVSDNGEKGREGTHATGLHLAVDERAGEASQKLLCLGVALRLAVLRAVVLVRLHGLVRGGAGDDLVRELGLVVRALEVLVRLVLVGVVAEETCTLRVSGDARMEIGRGAHPWCAMDGSGDEGKVKVVGGRNERG